MFRFIVITMVFICCTYIGFYFGDIYKYRSNELKEFNKAISFMNNEVLYSSTPLPTALLNISYKLKEPFSDLFQEMSSILEAGIATSVQESFNISYKKYEDDFHLKEDDRNIINDFFSSLGESGVYGQEKVFNLVTGSLERKYIEADEECKSNRKMYRCVGVCVGAILAIFFM